jgi:hypothetical protein
MKKIILGIILPAFVILCGLLLLSRCTERIISPNKDGSNVIIHIDGNKLNICKGDTVITNAAYAKFCFLTKKGTSYDTLFRGVLDNKGQWDSIYNIKLLGIPSVKVIGSLDLRTASDSLDYMCCNTTFTLNFNYDCNEVDVVKLSCDNLNTTVTLNLTNLVGGKIVQGSTIYMIKGNTFQLDTSSNLIVNVSNAIALSGDFKLYSISPEPASDGTIRVSSDTKPLVMKFSVNTTTPGKYTTEVNLPVTCIDDPSKTGIIKIILNAEIIEDACTCPFAPDNSAVLSLYPFSNSVKLGTTSPDISEVIINTKELSLGDGCYLSVDGVDRYNSDVPATTRDKSNIQMFEWMMMPQNFPVELRNGVSSFSMSTNFKPINLGESADTFNVRVSIHNASGEVKESCSLLVSFTASGCDDYCPVLIIQNLSDARLNPGNSKKSIGDSLDFDNTELTQKITGYVNTTCVDISDPNIGYLSYMISMESDSMSNMCNTIDISVTKSGTDASFFSTYFNAVQTDYYYGFSGDPVPFGIKFRVPTVEEFLVDHPDPLYTCDFTISVTNLSGKNCTQKIHVEATAQQISTKLSDIHTMLTFSQISDLKSTAAYKVFSINGVINGKQIVKLDPLNDVITQNGFEVPYPFYTGDASFYFDVDNPGNIAIINQMPKLYLMNTLGNQFSYITKFPVDSYSSADIFENRINDLVKKVFDTKGFSYGTHDFTFSNTSGPMWNNYMSKSDFIGLRNGVDINYGDVFIIWNPNSSQVTNIPGVYGGYCEVAFIYISKVSTGRENENADHLGNVQFIVAYPLSIVK